MKSMQKVLLYLLPILFVGFVLFLFINNNKETVTMLQDSVLPQDENMPADELSTTSGGKYVNHTATILDEVTTGRRVLYFYANWCPTCRPADAEFKAKENQIPKDTTVIRVNYNDDETDAAEEDLAKKYEVNYQHTFVQIDEMGNKITFWNGGQLAELLKNLQ